MAKNEISPFSEGGSLDSFLQDPGDYIYARVTKTGRKVLKGKNRFGKKSIIKYSKKTVRIESVDN